MSTDIKIENETTFRIANKKEYRDLTVPFDLNPNDDRTFYAVKVVWTTGDSNGRDPNPSVEHIMVYENEDVAFDCMDKIVFHHKEIERIEDYGYKPTKEEKKFDKYKVTVPLQEIGDNKLPLFASWEGHFERLISIEVIDLVLNKDNGRKRKIEF